MLDTSTDDSIERLSLKDFTEKAYLDYSMYVILDRALPHIGDGMKPVQRRIVYAMSELGLKAASKHKKSARTVGDVLGKYHPHGDSACYEAMVLMAQSFSYRYPLIDGQGNWGSQDDPKSFAAMRYTEARLAPYAEVLLKELGLGTVEWQPNFDGSLKEPIVLPARLPNVLLNGGTGIAVGMATDIPPHNLKEVANACIHLLDNPKSTIDELIDFIPGPDMPTEAEIISSRDDLRKIYETGRGSVRMRAVYTQESGDIVITALPYQVSGSKVLEQIASQMQQKKLPMVSDLRDESDHESPTRLVIVPRSNRIDVEQLMAHLFASTDLERTYRVNMNMIGIDGRPQVKDLRQILVEWLTWRTSVVRRRLEHRLSKVLDRLHILEGLMVAYLNIDEVIAIIRYEDDPKAELINRFNLSDIQADAILDLKLRHLAKLEEFKITSEQNELEEERKRLEQILGSDQRMRTLIKKELKEDIDTYGDDRRSPIVERGEAQAFSEKDLLTADPVTVVVSKQGWIRAAKGHDIEPTGSNVVHKTHSMTDAFEVDEHSPSDTPVHTPAPFKPPRSEEQLDLYTLEHQLELTLPPQEAAYLVYIDATSGHSDYVEPELHQLLLNMYEQLLKQVSGIYGGQITLHASGDMELLFDTQDDEDAHGVHALCAAKLFTLIYRAYNQTRIKVMQPTLNLHTAIVRGNRSKTSRMKEEALFLTRTTQSNDLISHTALTEATLLKSSLLQQASIQRVEEDKVLIQSMGDSYQDLLRKQAIHLLRKQDEDD